MASDGSEVIRELLVALGVIGEDDTVASLERIDQALDGTKRAMEAVVQTTAGVIASVVAVGAAGTAMAVSSANNAETLLQQAEALDVNVEALQGLDFAFQQVRNGTELMNQVLFNLQARAAQARDGNVALAESFGDLGITMTQLRGAGPIELVDALADALADADDKGKATAATMRLLGEDVARRVAPLLLQGSDGLRALKTEAAELGIITREDTLRSTAELALSWRKLQAVGSALADTIGQAIAPVVLEVTDYVLRWVEANDELIASGLSELVESLSRLFVDWAPVILAVSAGFLALAAAIAAVLALPTIAAFVSANAVLFIAAGIIANLVAVVGFLAVAWDDLNTYLEGGNSVIGELIESFEEWSPLLANVLKLVASLFGLMRSLVGLVFRVAGAFGEWALSTNLLRTQFGSTVAVLESLWNLINRNIEGTWLAKLADYVRVGSRIVDRVDPAAFGGGGNTTTTTTTNNNRADITQTVNVTAIDTGEAVAAALRAGREAVSGGLR